MHKCVHVPCVENSVVRSFLSVCMLAGSRLVSLLAGWSLQFI